MAMESKEITEALRERGYSQADVARLLEVSPVTVNMVIKGRTTSAKVRKTVAELIGKKVEEVWKVDRRKRPGPRPQLDA